MIKDSNYRDLDIIAENIINGQKLTDDNLRELLSLTEEEDIAKLQYVARKVRDHHFGNRVFLYSFVYF
jgi:methylornithine synthase